VKEGGRVREGEGEEMRLEEGDVIKERNETQGGKGEKGRRKRE
jgi:hypothetical protein